VQESNAYPQFLFRVEKAMDAHWCCLCGAGCRKEDMDTLCIRFVLKMHEFPLLLFVRCAGS
jgi:hypothetical protein